MFAPARLGPVTLRNRTVKAATFEGRTPDGQVTDALIDYHLAVARGGVGLTTVAYLAVAPEGRTHREQIVVGPDTAAGLARLAEAIHETGAAIAGQVGHAGPVANGRSNGVHALSASRMPSPLSMQMIRRRVRAGPDPDHRGVRRRRADPGARRLRRARAAHGAQLPDLVVPRAGAQPPQGRLGRRRSRTAPGWPGRSPAPYARRSATRSRSPRRSASATGSAGGVTTDESLDVRRDCSRPTATSTRCSSAAAAR